MRSDEIGISPENYRIMVYGDSIIWGGSLTAQKYLATEKLKDLLNQKNNNFEVGNISAGSWGPGNWLAHVAERGVFSAEVVILVISSHDWRDNPTYESIQNNIFTPTKKPKLATEELINRYIFPKIKILKNKIYRFNKKNKALEKNKKIKSKKGLKDLEKFINLVRDKGSELVVVQFWDRDEFINGYPKIGNYLIQKVLKEKNVKYVESYSKFKECSKNPKDLYFDNIHPFTKLGQKCLGYILFDAFRITKFYKNKIEAI